MLPISCVCVKSCGEKKQGEKKVHQTALKISKSSVQHFGSSRIKAAVLHTSTLQKKCKYMLAYSSSSMALICAEPGQSCHSQKLFWLLLSSPCDAWPSRQMFAWQHCFAPRQNDSFPHGLLLNAHCCNAWRWHKCLCLSLCNTAVLRGFSWSYFLQKD